MTTDSFEVRCTALSMAMRTMRAGKPDGCADSKRILDCAREYEAYLSGLVSRNLREVPVGPRGIDPEFGWRE